MSFIYLAGPINGCTDVEAVGWREEVKTLLYGQDWMHDVRLLDPMRRDHREGFPTSGMVVLPDKADIRRADVVLVYYWKPSVGTSMEILYAYEHEKPIVLVNGSGVSVGELSAWLRHHVSVFASTLDEGLTLCLDFLQ